MVPVEEEMVSVRFRYILPLLKEFCRSDMHFDARALYLVSTECPELTADDLFAGGEQLRPEVIWIESWTILLNLKEKMQIGFYSWTLSSV